VIRLDWWRDSKQEIPDHVKGDCAAARTLGVVRDRDSANEQGFELHVSVAGTCRFDDLDSSTTR